MKLPPTPKAVAAAGDSVTGSTAAVSLPRPGLRDSVLRWMRFAVLNVMRNRRRSLVTATVAALGTAAILLASGFALSTYQALAENAARTTGHLIVARAEHFDSDEDVPLQYGLDNAAAIQAQLLADPAVRSVLPRVDFSGLLSNGDKSTVVIAAGIDPDAEFAAKGPFLTVTAGKVLASGQRNTVMIGTGLAKILKAAPGSLLTVLATTTEGALNAVDMTVAGIFETGVPEIDKRLLYLDVASAQALLVTPRVSRLGVMLEHMDDTSGAQQRVQRLLPALTTQTWLDQATFYRSVRNLYNRIFGTLV